MKQEKKFSLAKLLAGRRFTVILSLVLAVLVWMYVITVVDPNQSKPIRVQVNLDFNSAAYTSQGLDIIDKPSKNITVYVNGDNSVIGGLSANDIQVYPDYASVSGSGKYSLKLKVEKSDTYKNYTIENTQAQYIDLTFEKVVTQKFAVNVNASGVQTADGYYMDLPVASPKEVTLSGPETVIKSIDKVVANVELNEVRTEPAIANAMLTYLDKTGKEVDDTYITGDFNQVEVTIPILKIKDLPISVEFTSVPAGYDTAQLGATLSQKTIRVAGPAELIDAKEKYECYVNLADFKLGESVLCNIELDEGLRNIDSLQTVTVSFDTLSYTTKTITVTELRAINLPANMKISFPTARINNVVLVGKPSELEALAETGVVAQVDAAPANISVMNAQQTMPVKIIIPGTQTVFATGAYTVLCDITTNAS
ncbi:MAG: CdaR family protein [Ruthenibacterium sp.]